MKNEYRMSINLIFNPRCKALRERLVFSTNYHFGGEIGRKNRILQKFAKLQEVIDNKIVMRYINSASITGNWKL